VERELADPAVYSDQQRLKNLSREQKELTPVVETFTALQQTEQAIAEAREMLSDPELRELAQEELTRTKEQRERLAALGCRLYQGYLYSPALPLDEFMAFAAKYTAVQPAAGREKQPAGME